jgi:hypothetical protein
LKSDAVTPVVKVDTTNSRVGIGVTPGYPLSVFGEVELRSLTFNNDGYAGWKTAHIVTINEGADFKGALAFHTHPAAGASPSYTTEKVRITSDGKTGFKTIAPTALVHIGAGTATAGTAPLKLTSATALLLVSEAGVINFKDDKFYGTITTGPTEKEIKLLDTYYGEAWFYTATGAASTAVAIDTTLLYHALVLATTAGLNSGFTHLAGQANAIASVAENSAGVSYKVTTTGNHNLTAGQPITHTGFTTRVTYRGKFIVQSTPSATEYVVLGTFLGTDTGFMKRAFTLRANTGSAGTYQCGYNKNIADADNIAAEAVFSLASRNQNIGSRGLLTLADGDYVWLSFANLTDGTDIKVRHCNLNLTRI